MVNSIAKSIAGGALWGIWLFVVWRLVTDPFNGLIRNIKDDIKHWKQRKAQKKADEEFVKNAREFIEDVENGKLKKGSKNA